VLQETAEILRQNARDIDRLGRYGGEEFLAVLPSTDAEGGTVFVERVRLAVEEHDFNVEPGTSLHLTVSAGVATWPNDRIGNAEALISLADDALYAAKAAGRNRVVRYDRMGDGKQG
jgi:diguanylate cyclase (GGDEF)-like protein